MYVVTSATHVLSAHTMHVVKPVMRARVLTPDFGTVNNLFKMALNGEVIYMKEFRIVDMNVFEVWAITVRFHLEGQNYA